MYCTRCGAQNPDDGTFCQRCGAPLAVAAASVPVVPASAARRTSGLAVASLVLGILGFVTLGFTSIPAIIFGGIAISQTAKDQNLDGRGMAVAGLVTGIVVLAFGLLFLALIVVGSVTAFDFDSLSV